jgi:cell division protein FtsB
MTDKCPTKIYIVIEKRTIIGKSKVVARTFLDSILLAASSFFVLRFIFTPASASSEVSLRMDEETELQCDPIGGRRRKWEVSSG